MSTAPGKIKHYPTCNPDYPEKQKGEPWQATTTIDLDDNEEVVTCNDCGAFVVQERKRP